MYILSRVLQFCGIVVAGVGLMYGVMNNDMTSEIIFAAIGIGLFVVGRALGPAR